MHKSAAEETHYILTGKISLLWSQISSFILHPKRYTRAMFLAQELSPPGIKKRLLHYIYCIEAVKMTGQLNKIDIKHIHVHMANNSAMVALLACEYDKSLSYSLSIHGSAEFFDIHGLTLKQKIEHAVFVRCISDFCKSQVMLCSSPDVWDRFSIVHCCVDQNSFLEKKNHNTDYIHLLTVGRIVPIKGYPVLLEACKQLSESGVKWKLDMVGDGPDLPYLKELSRSLGIDENVNFAGAIGQDKIMPYYRKADIMVISSFMEGVPVVLMEAMAGQLAVVASSVGGISELVENGKSGFLIPPTRVDCLVEALKKFNTEGKLLKKFGKSGQKKVQEEFSLDMTGQEMADLFIEKLNKIIS